MKGVFVGVMSCEHCNGEIYEVYECACCGDSVCEACLVRDGICNLCDRKDPNK